jgi:DNA-binding NarL/FixJ family response regulator
VLPYRKRELRALRSIRDLQPDVTVLNPLRLDEDSQEDLFALAGEGARLVFLVDTDGSGSYDAISRGVTGIITRTCTPRELCDAVAATARGRASFAPAAQRQIVAEMRLRNRSIQPYLTPRRREVLQLVANGLKDKELAERLMISEATVKSHLQAIYCTLEVGSRTQACLIGMRHGLII